MVCTLRITEWRARIRDFGASFLMLPNTGGHGLKGGLLIRRRSLHGKSGSWHILFPTQEAATLRELHTYLPAAPLHQSLMAAGYL